MTSVLRPTSCAFTNLRRATRAICRLYDLVLAPTHLKASQFMILQAIAESGEIAHCDLARDFAASLETLSRRLANARKAGLVEMRMGDRQKRMYRLTPQGYSALQEAWPYWERAQFRLHQVLGDNDWKALGAFAERVAIAAVRAEALPASNSLCCPAPGQEPSARRLSP